MDDIELGIGDCVRRLRELSAEVEELTATLRELQLRISEETIRAATLLTRRGDPTQAADCFTGLRRLSSAVGRSADQVKAAETRMLLELALMDNLLKRRHDERIPQLITRPSEQEPN